MYLRLLFPTVMAFLSGLVILAGCGGSSVGDNTAGFFPLTTGNQWHYNVMCYHVSSTVGVPDTLTLNVEPFHYYDNGSAYPVRFTFESNPSFAYTWNLKWEDSGLRKYGETYAGNEFRYWPSEVMLQPGLPSVQRWVSTVSVDDDLNIGPQSLSTTYEVVSVESVDTDMGSFDTAVKVKSYPTTGGAYLYHYAWYVEGVGMVRMEEYVLSEITGSAAISYRYSLSNYSLQP